MEEIIIELLAVLIGIGPLYFALRYQTKKEEAELERGRQFIKKACERIKNEQK
jgi:hypothetical protein